MARIPRLSVPRFAFRAVGLREAVLALVQALNLPHVPLSFAFALSGCAARYSNRSKIRIARSQCSVAGLRIVGSMIRRV